MGVGIPTYVRRDSSDAVYQLDSGNTATNEKRLNGFIEQQGGLEQNERLSLGYIRGDIDTSEGLTKGLSSINLRNLLAGDFRRLVTEDRKRK